MLEPSIKEEFYIDEVTLNVTNLNSRDYFWLFFVGFLSFAAFISAQEDFSYDYIHYINYFNVLGDFSFNAVLGSIYNTFPLPYVVVPPSGFFEIGFGTFVWILMQMFGSAPLTYALIASLSIAIRFWLLRKMELPWGWIIAINVYAVTLFEANAIRLGCSITLFLYGLLLIHNQKSLFFVFSIFILASLFHLQIFFQIAFFLFVYFFIKLVAGTKIRLAIYIAIIIFGGISLRIFSGILGFGKYVDYLNVESLAGGINVVTSLGLLVVLIFLLRVFLVPKNIYEGLISKHEARVWLAVTMTIIPALVIYVLIDNMGALGDRVWQMAFVVFAFNVGAKIWRCRVGSVGTVFLSLLIFVTNVNVIYRYTLSNFFYPFVKYTEIDPTFLER